MIADDFDLGGIEESAEMPSDLPGLADLVLEEDIARQAAAHLKREAEAKAHHELLEGSDNQWANCSCGWSSAHDAAGSALDHWFAHAEGQELPGAVCFVSKLPRQRTKSRYMREQWVKHRESWGGEFARRVLAAYRAGWAAARAGELVAANPYRDALPRPGTYGAYRMMSAWYAGFFLFRPSRLTVKYA